MSRWTAQELETLEAGIRAKETVPMIQRTRLRHRSTEAISLKMKQQGWHSESPAGQKLRTPPEHRSHINAEEFAVFNGARLDVSVVLDERDFRALEDYCRHHRKQLGAYVGEIVRSNIATLRWTEGSK